MSNKADRIRERIRERTDLSIMDRQDFLFLLTEVDRLEARLKAFRDDNNRLIALARRMIDEGSNYMTMAVALDQQAMENPTIDKIEDAIDKDKLVDLGADGTVTVKDSE
jgi:hypothetical protein